MAMRPRGGAAAALRRGGARSGAVRPVYEDFKPVSDWQQDDDTHILTINLHGFMKEQIKVSTESQNTIRVRGERLIAGNKWNRFSEDYQVPENGEMNSVRAKYQESGVLTITVPKGKVDALPPKTKAVDDIRKQPTPQTSPERKDGTSQATDGTTTEETDEEGTEPKKPRDEWTKQEQDGDQKKPTPQKGRDGAFSTVDSTSQLTDKKSLEPEKTLVDPKKEHDQDSSQRGRNFTPLRGTTVSHDTVRKESSEPKEKHVAPEGQDDARKTTADKQGKETVGSKESLDVRTDKNMGLEKDEATGIPEKEADSKELYEGFMKEKYKKAVKGLTELNEERQPLVNMGVAMLVIVALAAYVTYSLASAEDKK